MGTRARQRVCSGCREMRCVIGCRRLGSRMRGRRTPSPSEWPKTTTFGCSRPERRKPAEFLLRVFAFLLKTNNFQAFLLRTLAGYLPLILAEEFSPSSGSLGFGLGRARWL